MNTKRFLSTMLMSEKDFLHSLIADARSYTRGNTYIKDKDIYCLYYSYYDIIKFEKMYMQEAEINFTDTEEEIYNDYIEHSNDLLDMLLSSAYYGYNDRLFTDIQDIASTVIENIEDLQFYL